MKQMIFKSLVVRSLAFIMLIMCTVPASAQYYMNVYKNDGQKYQFLVSDIDSVSITQDIINNSHNGYEYVDLGLPSGLKWATCNVGADTPEDYGDYFAWGETSPKSDYEWETYKFRTSGDGDSYDNLKFSKYNTDSDYGPIDTKTTLDLIDDAARVNRGGSWRMPTEEDWNELRDNCAWTWTTLNGVKGYKVVSKSNGNSIFLPAAGFRYGTAVIDAGSVGTYWSSSLHSDNPDNAYCLLFGSDYVSSVGSGVSANRYGGLVVRAVCLDTENIPTSYTISFNANGGEGEMLLFEIWSDETPTLPICTFTRDGYEFTGWNTKADGSGASYGNEQSITVAENLVLYAQWKEIPTHNGYEYVDLGLPSGLKWATCNVGAESPEDYGDYFAWGETSPKSDYDWDTYKYYSSSTDELTKYCTDSDYGPTDTKTTLDLIDDAARVNWGGSWRMPTRAEQDELREECTWTWTTLNGIKGCKVTSKSNGNSIFLPAAGCRDGGGVDGAGSDGVYWSSSLSSGSPYEAYYLGFDSGDVGWSDGSRCQGRTVRAVCLDTENIPTSYTISFNANGGEGEMLLFEIWSDETPTLPICTFTRDGYEFTGWNTKADGSGASYGNEQSITVAENLVLYAQWKEIPTHNGYEYVDLGLPSGLKWATCNVGAESPEDYGDYFAWGETSPKSDYEWETYKFRTSGDNWDNVKFSKYNTDSDYGPIDTKTTLDLIDDAARVNWGGSWRMPTRAEQDELREKCTWTWTTLNGIEGYKVTSKSNGNSIFLPAAGYRDGTGVYYAGYCGTYWSSSLNSGSPFLAYYLYFSSGYVDWDSYDRSCGLVVRAVCLDTENIPTSYTISFNANGGEGEMSLFEIWSDETPTLPICTFTRDGYEFIGWNTKADGSGASYGNEQSITVAENLVLYAQWKEIPTHNGYEYVDLGLSVKWATCNIGAESPEGYGSYFAWGETEPKSNYSWSTYKHCNCNNGSLSQLTKYNVYSGWGIVDNITTLELEDDAARVNWGGSWRMPTRAEQDELREKCTWTWTTLNGIKGYKVTSKSNGNSIFLPVAGCRDATGVYNAGYGYYWSSSLYSSDSSRAYCLFSGSGVDWNGGNRCIGYSVRAVCQ